MQSDPYLPKCPKCDAWPMSISEPEEGYRSRVKFVCARCATETNAQMRHASVSRPADSSPAR